MTGSCLCGVLTESFKAQHEDADVVGVNMRLFDQDALAGVEVRFPNGSEWSGEGPYDFRHAAMLIGHGAPW